MMVSDLNIAQVRRKYGLDMRENYNLPKSENAKQTKCPEKKEKAIRKALEHFGKLKKVYEGYLYLILTAENEKLLPFYQQMGFKVVDGALPMMLQTL